MWSSSTRRRPATACSTCACRRRRARRSGPGLVQREAAKIVDLLHDPSDHGACTWSRSPRRCRSTRRSRRCAQLRGPLGLPLGCDRREPRPPASLRSPRLSRALRGGRRRRRARRRSSSRGVADRAAEESGLGGASTQANLERLRAGAAGAPIVELPYLFAEEFGRRRAGARSSEAHRSQRSHRGRERAS